MMVVLISFGCLFLEGYSVHGGFFGYWVIYNGFFGFFFLFFSDGYLAIHDITMAVTYFGYM